MKKSISLSAILYSCLVFLACSSPLLTQAQTAAGDRDGDGIPDIGGQDKCPTTLSKIKGRKATTVDEISGQEITIRLPQNLEDYVFQDKIPLDAKLKELLNTQAEYKREKRRVDEKYGKYADMKGKDRKEKSEGLDSVIIDYQEQIDSMRLAIRNLDPDSYVEFVGNIIDQNENVLKENVKVKIRIRVDAFGCLKDDDQDGSPNMVDLCPDEKGSMESSGCPDRDEDTVPDREDDCPDTPGAVELKGCPDRDKDGVGDPQDDCPDTPGVVELKGCPDQDQDGIRDQDDQCPEIPGPKETQGCPDRDKDTVIDMEDECPDVPGTVENKGCPEILEKASRVLFETGKAIIKSESYSILDELVALLQEYPRSYISLAGHTDSEGSESDNLMLSKNRAQAVKNYLIEKGISEDRITSTGYGEMRPVDSNETAEGRAKNRRVEMKLSNEKITEE